jgi:hypothetical protein
VAQGQHFVDAVREGTPFRSGAADGLAVVRLLSLGSEALKKGAEQRLVAG